MIEVAIVGAGPIGLETAHELKAAGVGYVHFDRGQIAETISWFPQEMTFFSSTDRIALAGMPIQTTGQRKCTKEEYLAYLRSFALANDLRVRTYEEVVEVAREDDGFRLRTRTATGEHEWSVRKLILAIGDMHGPRLLGIPGEDLPHVSHYFVEPHRYFRKKLLVVGGRNSAVEAALRCWHAGADVTLSYRGDALDADRVKYWLLPELLGRIERGEMRGELGTVPVEIAPGRALLRRGADDPFEVEADFVLLLTGYVADATLFESLGIDLEGEERKPVYDPRTMETNVLGVYVAGTATAGTQAKFMVFIETCHVHARRIAAALTGAPPPDAPEAFSSPES